MKTTGMALSSVAFVVTASITMADVPHTFSSGTPAKASEVNDNFAYLDSRIQSLESPTYIVECASNSKALTDVVNSLPYGETSLISVSGNCVVDDYLDFFHRSAFIYSDSNASIEGLGTNDVFSVSTGSLLYLRGISVRTDTAQTVISVTNRSHLRLHNVTVSGTSLSDQHGIWVGYNSSAHLREGVNISQVQYGVVASYGSMIAVRGAGHTITTSGGDNHAVEVSWGAVLALRADASSMNGNIYVGQNSNMRLDSGTTINGAVAVRDNSYARLRGVISGNVDQDSSSKVEY